MKALILNSGLGSRMGALTSEHPKCMTELNPKETILSRQLRQLAEAGIEEVVMTTGLFDTVLVNYCLSLGLPLHYTFVKNPRYAETNYIYSIYCARAYLDDDILLLRQDILHRFLRKVHGNRKPLQLCVRNDAVQAAFELSDVVDDVFRNEIDDLIVDLDVPVLRAVPEDRGTRFEIRRLYIRNQTPFKP